MRKKLLALFCVVASMALFAGCGDDADKSSSSSSSSSSTPTHTHSWAADWSKDATGHWHACTDETCVEKSDSAAHTPSADDGDCTTEITCSVCGYVTTAAAATHAWDEGEVTTPATTSSKGVKTFTCETCGTTKTEEIPELEGFSVSFNTDGAGEIETQAVKDNEKATKPADPNKEGAIFTGWTKDGEAFDFDTAITADTVLTATYETWSVEKWGTEASVTLDGWSDDAEALGGKTYQTKLLSSAADTMGVKISLGGADGIDVSNYAHVFIRLKVHNPSAVTTCTLAMSANHEPTAADKGYPYWDPVAAQSSDVWRHYVSYDLKELMTSSDNGILKDVYIARIAGGTAEGLYFYIDHIDFVEEALKLDNVTSYKNEVSNKTYTVVSGADSQKGIVKDTASTNNDRARFVGWDFDIYTGKYVFIGNFRQALEDVVTDENARALTLTFDNIDLTQYEHVYVRLKNYNSDPESPANCTISLKVNGAAWQNVPTADWTPDDVASGEMYTGYIDYDICSIADLTTLSSFTMYRTNAVNGYQYGIMMYIESITFVPKAA